MLHKIFFLKEGINFISSVVLNQLVSGKSTHVAERKNKWVSWTEIVPKKKTK